MADIVRHSTYSNDHCFQPGPVSDLRVAEGVGRAAVCVGRTERRNVERRVGASGSGATCRAVPV
jgi:hypothetical protein